MKIAIGCDHAVIEIKNSIKKWLLQEGYDVIDCGTKTIDRTHYPIYGRRVGILVSKKEVDLGIVICGTGVGIANAANKVKGVRATLTREVIGAIDAKSNYNANILALGGRVTGTGLMQEIITAFIKTKYNGNNKKVIEEINSKISNLDSTLDIFDNILNDWEKGKYES